MKHLKTFENNNLEEHLINSIKSDRLYKVKELIENKLVDKNFKNKYGKSPIVYAIEYGKERIVKYLLSIEVDLNIRDTYGRSPLIYAALYSLSSYDILCDIIDAGADWNIKNNDGDDFLVFLYSHMKNNIINKYSDKYEEYLIKKNQEKYNL